jgi:hypothetical protein
MSLHAGMVVVADGTASAATRIERVLTSDPGMASSVTPTPGMKPRLHAPAAAASMCRTLHLERWATVRAASPPRPRWSLWSHPASGYELTARRRPSGSRK